MGRSFRALRYWHLSGDSEESQRTFCCLSGIESKVLAESHEYTLEMCESSDTNTKNL
jgi:hypothetical protein